jgi:hypothetical protein
MMLVCGGGGSHDFDGCPVHNQNAKRVLEQGPDNKLSYKVHGCSDALTDGMKKSLGTAG